MKNIIKIFKNILSNNRGKMSPNVATGLGLAVFATIIGYNTYTAYNNSPAYNPERRAIYTGEGLNVNVNSFDGDRLDLQTHDTLPGATYGGNNITRGNGARSGSSAVRSSAEREQANFEAARAYLDSQRLGANQAGDGYDIGSYETGAYSNGDVYDPFGSTYDEGIQGIEPGHRSGPGARQFQAAQQATAAAAGAAKGKKGNTRQATQVGKLSASNGGSSVAGAKGGNTVGGATAGGTGAIGTGTVPVAGNPKGGKDSNTRPIPQGNVRQAPDADAFRFGRGGSEGGFNVARGGDGGEAKGGRGSNAKSELQAAYSLSSKAVATLQTSGEKSLAQGAQEAANAFDGGISVDEGMTLAGEIPLDISGNKLGFKRTKSNLGLDKIEVDFETDSQKQGRLQRNVWNHMINAGIITVAACFLIAAVMKMEHWVKYIIAGVITAAALYAIFGADYDGDGVNIYKSISELADLRKKANMSNQNWIYYTLMCGVYPAALGIAWWQGMKAADKATKGFMKMVNQTATTAFGNRMKSAVSSSINASKNKAKNNEEK